jgi:hypothetical protein
MLSRTCKLVVYFLLQLTMECIKESQRIIVSIKHMQSVDFRVLTSWKLSNKNRRTDD